eukprot:jgi/Tetstr1/450507/TSEL_037543.t1
MEPVGPQRFGIGIAGPAGDDRRVQLALSKKTAQLKARAGHHFDLDAGMGRTERAKSARKKGLRIFVDGAEPQAPAYGQRLECAQRFVIEADHRRGVFEKLQPIGRQHVAPPFPFEQRHADNFFKAFHLGRDCRLCLVHPLASGTETAGFGNGQKGAQEIGIE